MLIRLLSIRPAEAKVVSRIVASLVVTWAGFMIGASGVESLLFTRFGPHALPYLFIAVAPATLVAMFGVGSLVDRRGPRQALSLISGGLAVGTVGIWLALLTVSDPIVYPITWLAMMLFWTVQVLASWGVANLLHDVRQAKRLFPIYGGAIVTGAVVGGLATGVLANLMAVEHLAGIWALAAGVGAFTSARTLARFTNPSLPTPKVGAKTNVISEGLRASSRSELIRWMAISQVGFALLYFLVTFLFASAATEAFPDTAELAGFLGVFMGIANLTALVTSMFVANRISAWLGATASVLLMAAIYLAGFATIALVPAFLAIAIFRFIQLVGFQGIFTPGFQALYNLESASVRDRIRAFIDGAPLQLGVALTGGVLLLADEFLRQSHLTFIGLAFGIVTGGAAWMIKRSYPTAVLQALMSGNPDVFEGAEISFSKMLAADPEAMDMAMSRVRDPSPQVRRLALECLAKVPLREIPAGLDEALKDTEPSVRQAAVAVLGNLMEAGQASFDTYDLDRLLADPDPGVRAQVAVTLSGTPSASKAQKTIAAMVASANPDERAAALEANINGKSPDLERLALDDPSPIVRGRAIELLSKETASIEVLVQALADPHPSVIQKSAASLAEMRDAKAPLLRAMRDPQRQEGAVWALSMSHDPAWDELQIYASGQAELAGHYGEMIPSFDDRAWLLTKVLRERMVIHTRTTLRALGAGESPGDLSKILDELQSNDPRQRANALELLEASAPTHISKRLIAVWEGSSPARDDTEQTLGELLDDNDPWVRAAAAVATQEMGIDGLERRLGLLAGADESQIVREAASNIEQATMETTNKLSTMQRVLVLGKVALFDQLSAQDLQAVAAAATEYSFDDGEAIASQGETGDEMHVVTSGEVRVIRQGPEGPQELARRPAGTYVGEMSLLSGVRRMASLVAEGQVTTLGLDRGRFKRILLERPQASFGVMQVLSERLREAHGDGPVEGRL